MTTTSFSVPAGMLPFWRARLAAGGIATRDVASRFGDETLAFDDP